MTALLDIDQLRTFIAIAETGSSNYRRHGYFYWGRAGYSCGYGSVALFARVPWL